jgi:hypothetical protein
MLAARNDRPCSIETFRATRFLDRLNCRDLRIVVPGDEGLHRAEARASRDDAGQPCVERPECCLE